MVSPTLTELLAIVGLVINILLLVATALLAYYAYGQWRAVDNTLKEIKAQTPAVLKSADAAADSAAIAKSVADASDATSKATLAEMRKQSVAETTLAAATDSVAATAVKQLDMSERPLIVIEQTNVSDVFVASNRAYFGYNIDLQVANKGHSSALDSVVLTNLVTSTGDYNPKAELNSTCHEKDRLGPLSGTIIPPGENRNLQVQPLDTTSFREAILSSHLDPISGSRQLLARLSVCVLFKGSLSKEVHHSGLIYDMAVTFSSDDVKRLTDGKVTLSNPIYATTSLHLMEIMNGVSD